MFYVYLIQNKINNKIYIGQTNDYEYRWFCHLNNAFNENTLYYNTYIARAIRKHGKDNFNFHLIETHDLISDTNEAEEFFISYFNSANNNFGYNIKLGGNNHKMSIETKKKIGMANSIANKGKKMPQIVKDKISKALKGKIVSKKARENLSKSLKGNKNCLNRKLSKETRNKISLGNKGNKNCLGVKRTFETRFKNSRHRLILNKEDVENIFIDFNLNKLNKKELSFKYNVSIYTIKRVIKGIYFNRVKDEL